MQKFRKASVPFLKATLASTEFKSVLCKHLNLEQKGQGKAMRSLKAKFQKPFKKVLAEKSRLHVPISSLLGSKKSGDFLWRGRSVKVLKSVWYSRGLLTKLGHADTKVIVDHHHTI